MISICALIIAVALAYASYLYMPNLGQQPLHQNSLAMSPASRYAYAVSSDSTISTLSIPIMTQYSDCDVCGTEVKCPIGDCHLTNYVCKGVRTSLCITTSTSTSTTSTTITTTIPTTSIHTTTSTSTTSTNLNKSGPVIMLGGTPNMEPTPDISSFAFCCARLDASYSLAPVAETVI